MATKNNPNQQECIYKAVSYIERTHNNKFIPTTSSNIERCSLEYKTETITDNNRLVKKVSLQNRDKTKLNKFKVSDFSYENLKRVGALDNLGIVKMSSDRRNIVESLTGQINKLDNNTKNKK